MKKRKWSYREIVIMKRHYESSTAEEIQALIPERTIRAISQKAVKMGLKKKVEAYEHCLYKKGQKPWNKGLKFESGGFRGRFQKGNKPHNTKQEGHRSLRTNQGKQYWWVKKNGEFIQEHKLKWQEANGAIPKAKFLVCINGNTMDTEASNWKLVNRGELMKINCNTEKSIKTRQYQKLKKEYAFGF